MKSKLTLTLILTTLLSIAAFSQNAAPQTEPSTGSTAAASAHQHGDFMQMLTQKLNLTADQQAKLKPVLEQQHQQMRALRTDTSLTPEQKQAKVQELRENTHNQINAILTPEQQQQFAQLRAEHKGHMKGAVPSTPQQ
ncbi:MAG TPA: hypothetical protein VEG30_13110 [Terriglobales bacterium]|nr:hypothetical protein [Terriglobales bacterium]